MPDDSGLWDAEEAFALKALTYPDVHLRLKDNDLFRVKLFNDDYTVVIKENTNPGEFAPFYHVHRWDGDQEIIVTQEPWEAMNAIYVDANGRSS